MPEVGPGGLPASQSFQPQRPGHSEIGAFDGRSHGVKRLVVAQGKSVSLLAIALPYEPVAHLADFREALRGVFGEGSGCGGDLPAECHVARLAHADLFVFFSGRAGGGKGGRAHMVDRGRILVIRSGLICFG